MASKKTDAEADLDKQYKEYKAQFETWKEKNKTAVGTDAYNKYVQQFESWEKDVDKRRRMIREKAEREALEARIMAEEEERERQAMAAKEAEAAEAYAQSQQAYMAHHQAAMEAEQRQQQKIQQQPAVQVHVQAHATLYQQPPPQIQAQQNDSSINTDVVLREMMSVVLGSANAAMGGAPTVTQQPPPSQQPTAAPELWGTTKAVYDSKDPLFNRWGPRAAPPHIAPMPRPAQVPAPCWMLMEQLREKKKILAPHVTAPPPQFAPNIPPPAINGVH